MASHGAEIIPIDNGNPASFSPGDRVWFFNATGCRVEAHFEQLLGAHARITVADPAPRAGAMPLDVDVIVRVDRLFHAATPPHTDETKGTE